jgi:hypothetical protein
MREVIHIIRKAIIDKLNGSVELRGSQVPIYGRVPTDATYPFVRVYSVSNNEVDQNQSTYNMEVITRIEVVTRFESDSGGELDCNLIVDECLSLLRTRSADYFNLSEQGFNVYTSENEGISYLEDDFTDHTYFRAIIELSNRVEQIPPSGGLQNELQIELQS